MIHRGPGVTGVRGTSQTPDPCSRLTTNSTFFHSLLLPLLILKEPMEELLPRAARVDLNPSGETQAHSSHWPCACAHELGPCTPTTPGVTNRLISMTVLRWPIQPVKGSASEWLLASFSHYVQDRKTRLGDGRHFALASQDDHSLPEIKTQIKLSIQFILFALDFRLPVNDSL